MKPDKILARLSPRERYSVYAMLACVGLFVLIQWVVFPLMERRDQLRRNIRIKETTLLDIQLLKVEYEELKASSALWKEKIGTRPPGFTLFSFMDELAGKAGVEIAYMKPSTSKPKNSPYTISKVELKLQGITIKQLPPFLHMVETSEYMVYIRRMSITKKEKEGTIDVVLQVETFEA
jgi:general secretion pathway protein M